MARIRTIKPEFPQSESMGRVSRDARLLFILLWTLCDDAGRSRGGARLLKGLLFPYDELTLDEIDSWLAELEAEGCIQQYDADGSRYLAICNWLNHQKIDKPSRSRIPEPRESSRILSTPSRTFVGGSKDLRIEGSKDQGSKELSRELAKATVREDDYAEFEQVKIRYPARAGACNWLLAQRAMANRINDGATWQQLREGAERYARYCDATGNTGTQYVKGPEKFFSDVDQPWAQAWDLPKPAGRPNGAPKITTPPTDDEVAAEIRKAATENAANQAELARKIAAVAAAKKVN